MSDQSSNDLSLDIEPLRPATGAVHVSAGVPSGYEDRVLGWLREERVIGAVDFWLADNPDRLDEDGVELLDLYVSVATDERGIVQLRAADGSLEDGPVVEELRARLQAELGADDVIFDDWQGAGLWQAGEDDESDSTGLPGDGVEGIDAITEVEIDAAIEVGGADDVLVDPAETDGVEFADPDDRRYAPELVHALSFSHRGTAHAHLIAAQAKRPVQAGHAGGWSVFRYASESFVELMPPRKKELPAITVRSVREDYAGAWIEIDPTGSTEYAGYVIWPDARASMRPVFEAHELDEHAAKVQARIADEALDPESDLHALATDALIGPSVDRELLHSAVAPHATGTIRSPRERIETALVGLGLPPELVLPAVRGDRLPEHLDFEPVGAVNAMLHTVAAGRAGLRPVDEPLTVWDNVEQRVRHDPRWALGLVSGEVALGVGAIVAGRLVSRDRGWLRTLLTSTGLMVLTDAALQAWLTRMRTTSGQPTRYRANGG